MRKSLSTIWRIIKAPFLFIRWCVVTPARALAHIYREIQILLTLEVDDDPLPDTLAKTVQNPMGLFEHINALRKHIFRAVVFMAVTTVFSFIYTSKIIDILAKPVGGIRGLRAIDITEPISVFMRVALVSGFALALPYIIFELWLFAAPGLKKRSRLMSLISIPISLVLFIGGMAFAYYVMLPVAVPFLTNFMGMTTDVRPSSYVSFVTSVLFWIGIAFEFPLLIYFLALTRIVKAKMLLDQWRIAVIFIAVAAAAITPTVDPINMSIVMGPMILLYFLGVGFAFLAQRGDTTST